MLWRSLVGILARAPLLLTGGVIVNTPSDPRSSDREAELDRSRSSSLLLHWPKLAAGATVWFWGLRLRPGGGGLNSDAGEMPKLAGSGYKVPGEYVLVFVDGPDPDEWAANNDLSIVS
jgi:hypothetical protein